MDVSGFPLFFSFCFRLDFRCNNIDKSFTRFHFGNNHPPVSPFEVIVGLVADDEVGAQQFPDAVSLLQGCCLFHLSIFGTPQQVLDFASTRDKIKAASGGCCWHVWRDDFVLGHVQFSSKVWQPDMPHQDSWHDISHHLNPFFRKKT